MIEKKWILKAAAPTVTEELQAKLNINKNICRTLVARNILDYQTAQNFFRPAFQDLHDPFLMKDMHQAVDIIQQAYENKLPIRIYGDYDVDGTTAVAVLYSFMNKYAPQSTKLSYYIPNRYTEGYGISRIGIDKAHADGIKLLIAVDCGIKAHAQIAYAASLGMQVIVCDHHLPDDTLPEAVAILNPKQATCNYPFKELSGCGIAYKLVCALHHIWKVNNPKASNELLDLVATSIASDIVPIYGENRILAYWGLKKANTQPCIAIATLKDQAGIHSNMTISRLVFMIGPRINAAGRMNDANKVVQLLIEDNPKKAIALASILQVDNEDRKALDKAITEEAIQMLEDFELDKCRSIVLHNPSWHKGIVGIVASRIIEYAYKPTIILTTSEGKVTGSARSVEGFDIHHAIESCKELIDNFGGHQYAAGLTLPVENLEAFQKQFETVVRDQITDISLQPNIYIDACVQLDELNESFLNIIEQFEPCGPENFAPMFLSRQLKDAGNTRIVKDTHLQLHLTDGKQTIKGIAFGMAHWFDTIKADQAIDIIYHIERNEWNGITSVNLRILDIKTSREGNYISQEDH